MIDGRRRPVSPGSAGTKGTTPSAEIESDAGLIREAQAGDREAANELFKRERRYLFNYLHQMTEDPATADDLTQETICRALRKLSGFNRRASFRTWLTKIALNVFRNDYRKRKRHASLCLDRFVVPAGDGNPERLVVKSELQWCVVHTLRHHLPRLYREALVLRDLHSFSYEDIAAITGGKPGQAKTRVHRARKLFQNRLMKDRCRAFTNDYLCVCEEILELDADRILADFPGARGECGRLQTTRWIIKKLKAVPAPESSAAGASSAGRPFRSSAPRRNRRKTV